MVKPFSLAKYFYVSLILACFGSAACSADNDFNGEKTMDQENLASDKEPISIETEATTDAMLTDPKSLALRDNESPMPVLDSVDDVLLTPEEEERAIDEARDKEKYTKTPSGPKTPPSKE